MKYLSRFFLSLLLLAGLVAGVMEFSRPPRTNYTAELFQGVTYQRRAVVRPRPLMIHTVKIDLATPGIYFLVTPGDPTGGMEGVARTTSDFLAEFKLQLAINGSFFDPCYVKSLWDYYPHTGDPVGVNGLAISNGQVYSADFTELPVLCLSPGLAQIRPAGCPPGVSQALAGGFIFVRNGAAQNNLDNSLHPRTAVATNPAGNVLWLVVVDGRQDHYSEGVTLAELAQIILGLGADTALNLDGGGSTTLVMAGPWGPQTLNAPINSRIPMRQRPVANHLGVYARPVTTGYFFP